MSIIYFIKNGVLSALPYLCGWIFAIVTGYISDKLIKKGIVSVGVSRKLFNTIGHFGPAAGLVWLAFVGCDRVLAVVALCFAVGLNGAIYSGWQVI